MAGSMEEVLAKLREASMPKKSANKGVSHPARAGRTRRAGRARWLCMR